MRGEKDIRQAIMQNLKDAGCTKKQAEEFFELYDLDYLILDIINNYDGGK